MKEELFNITLLCTDCENISCRIGQIVHSKNDGCVRQVNEWLYVQYFHQLKEVWEMSNKNQKDYVDTINILNKVYKSPVVNKYGKGFVPQLLQE